MKYYKKIDAVCHWKSVLGVILRYKKHCRLIQNQLKKRLPYEPTKKQINWCYWDFLKFKIKYNGSLDVDYFNADIYRKSEFVRQESLANYTRKVWRNSIQDKKYWDLFKDKRIFYKEFSEYLGRKWLYIDKNTPYSEYLEFISENNNVVFAKIPTSNGGKDVKCYQLDTDKKIRKLYFLCKKNPMILEEKLLQCEEIFSFSGKSVNTFRIITIVDDNGNPHIAAAVLRMGSGFSDIDNFSVGGILAPIDTETGIIKGAAKDKFGKEYILHPTTKKQIVGFKIPNWKKYKDFACELAKKFPSFRYVGWDIIMNADGKLCVIEGNKDAGVQMENQFSFGLKPNYDAMLNNDKSYDFSKYRL